MPAVTAEGKATEAHLHAAADRRLPEMTLVLAAALGEVRASLSLDVIQAHLEAGDVDGLLDAVPWEVLSVEPLLKADGSTAEQLWHLILSILNDASAAAGLGANQFTLVNQAAVNVARQAAALLVHRVSATTRQAIRVVITDALRGRYTVRQAAVVIRQSVGLTPRMAQAVSNYAAALNDAVASGRSAAQVSARYALADARFTTAAPSPAQQARMVERYAERWIKYRAEMIARTETMRAANRGLLLGWERARSEGLLPPGVRKVWQATPDERTCPECGQTDTETANFGENFSLGVDAPPAHPLCRCTMSLDFGSVGVATGVAS